MSVSLENEEIEEIDPVELNRDPEPHLEIINQLLENNEIEELQAFIKDLYPGDLADVLQMLDFEYAKILFSALTSTLQGETLYELNENLSKRFLTEFLTPKQSAACLTDLPTDKVADLLGLLKTKGVGDILVHMPFVERSMLLELLSYPEDTAGALMDKQFVAVREHLSISKAITALRKAGKDIDDVHTIYVVDDQGRYRGNVSLTKMILTKPRKKIKSIMQDELLPIPINMDQEEIADFFTKYDFITAPVVDEHGTMLGRITVDDILEVVREEASEDILRMSGMSGEETLDTPVWKSSLQRILWLSLNLATAFMSAGVVRLFETTITKVVILAALMPVVAGMGGNAGGQTLALVVRNLALGELTNANAWKTLAREMLIGLLNGLTIGFFSGIIVLFLTNSLFLASIISTALLANLFIAAVAGSTLPIMLQKMNIDPAIASTILVTTLTDTMGFFVFLGLAWLLIT